MQFITQNEMLSRNILRCINQYENVSFATAWASFDTEVFKKLTSSRIKIKKGVIGTHFFQTHPDVIDQFVESTTVRFMLQPSGVFHPKIYVFWSSGKWEAFIGSANLTKGAFGKNSEAVLLITNANLDEIDLRYQITDTISNYWGDAKVATSDFANRYREMWKLRQPMLQSLSAEYGKTSSSKLLVESETMSISWRDFYKRVGKDKYHSIDRRCGLLADIEVIFGNGKNFGEMDEGERRLIAGLPHKTDDRWPCFGSMKGDGIFHSAIKNNDKYLSKALKIIPMAGPVSRWQYDSYIEGFLRAFPGGRSKLAGASRLLAMKRPDQFICLNAMNKKNLCSDFGIAVSGMNYARYWDEIIERIRDSIWWRSPSPSEENILELAVWKGRAAMLDGLFYHHE